MMDIGAILVGIALLVGIGAFVTRPLFKQRSAPTAYHPPAASPGAQLAARRDAVYALIRELDADYQTGKVNNQDYQAQRERYVAEGVSILKQMDALGSQNGRAALEAELEAKVLALRQTRSTAATRRPPAPRFCTKCGQPADPADRFCAHCGSAIKGAASR